MSEMREFDAALAKMGAGIRRSHTAFDLADQGFIEALEALKAITQARGSLEDRLSDMQDTITRLQTLVMELIAKQGGQP